MSVSFDFSERQSVADRLAEHLVRTRGKRLFRQRQLFEVGDDRVIAMHGHLLEQAEPEQGVPALIVKHQEGKEPPVGGCLLFLSTLPADSVPLVLGGRQ